MQCRCQVLIDLDELHGKVLTHEQCASLIKDYVAVRNSLVYTSISNGAVEGWNSRIKMLHRRGGGRSGLELLNAYAVLSG